MLLAATNIAADLYLRHFKIDVEDNLLARKQVTQVRVLKGALNTLIAVMTVAAALMTFEQAREPVRLRRHCRHRGGARGPAGAVKPDRWHKTGAHSWPIA